MTEKQAIKLGAKFKVHIGYTRKGNDHWVYFDSLDKAQRAVGEVFVRTQTVLLIAPVVG